MTIRDGQKRGQRISKLVKSCMTKDLTVGTPLKRILFFAFPLYLGILFQQFYNMVDTVIVGKYLGIQALAGVGATGCVNFFVLGFCNGLCSGFSIPVAQHFGARQNGRMRSYVANSLWLGGIFAVVLTVLVCLFCRGILLAINTPEDVFSYAYSYLFIIFLGIPLTILYNLLAGILRALGDSRTPVIFLIVSSLLNIVLDLLTIFVFHMSVSGPAAATVVSQGAAGIVCLFYMKKKYPVLRMTAEERKPSLSCMKTLCRMGIPMGLQYSVTAIGSIIVQTSMNALGSSVVAAVTAAHKIHGFLGCPLEALGATMAPYAGQNLGARRVDRIGKGTLDACLCGFAASALIIGIILLAGRQLIGIFLDKPDELVISFAYRFLVTLSSFYCLLTIVNVVRFSIQGMGYSGVAILSGVMELLARAAVGLLLAPRYGFSALCYAHPLAWFMADCFLLPTFFICKRKVRQHLALTVNG